MEFQTDREKYIWLAAWIDTEGNISLQKRNDEKYRNRGSFFPYMAITNTDENVLPTLIEITKGKERWSRQQKNGWRDKYKLYMGPNRCRELLPQIIPFLVVKQKQGQLLLKALVLLRENMCLAGNRGIQKEVNRTQLKNNFDQLNAIYEEMKKLNRRGQCQV